MSQSSQPLPGRPRLADYALARRHIIDGHEIVVLHDTRSGDLVRMPPRAWTLIEAADGTRDIGGLMLAASQKGALYRSSELVSVLTDLNNAGLLTDGIDPFALEPAKAGDPRRPLDVLPFTLVCDGSGLCCATYSTVRFTREEARRALVLSPNKNSDDIRAFLPLSGSGAQPSCAATAIDGRCAYLAEDGACELHRAHGLSAKPSGCAIYPATFVDDGEAVRVSLGVECTCVAASIGRTDGAPLVPAEAKIRGDLPAGVEVATLPDLIEIDAGQRAPREAVVRFSRAALGALEKLSEGSDRAAVLWSLAVAAARGDLTEETALAAVNEASPPAEEALMPWLRALSDRASAKLASADHWRSKNDRVRNASRILAQTAASLANGDDVARLLEGESAPRALEAFYLRANLHGCSLLGEIPFASALRDRAVRLLFARALLTETSSIQSSSPPEITALPLVEAMMRAQGVKDYARMVQ